MSYIFSSANNHTVIDGGKYFIDANIWIKILQPPFKPTFKEREYRTLFEAIVANNKCKIIVSSLLLSELINRIIREVYLNKFKNNYLKLHPGYPVSEKSFYKDIYRQSSEFKRDYSLVCYEIKNFHQTIELINDGLGSDVKIKHILSNPVFTLDFNDNYYYLICKKNNFIIITDDKDFWLEDVSIITLNETLKNKNINYLISQNKN